MKIPNTDIEFDNWIYGWHERYISPTIKIYKYIAKDNKVIHLIVKQRINNKIRFVVQVKNGYSKDVPFIKLESAKSLCEGGE
jgi:hypothetical protein